MTHPCEVSCPRRCPWRNGSEPRAPPQSNPTAETPWQLSFWSSSPSSGLSRWRPQVRVLSRGAGSLLPFDRSPTINPRDAFENLLQSWVTCSKRCSGSHRGHTRPMECVRPRQDMQDATISAMVCHCGVDGSGNGRRRKQPCNPAVCPGHDLGNFL